LRIALWLSRPAWIRRYHRRRSRRKRRFSFRAELCLSAILGVLMAFCSERLCWALCVERSSLVHDWEVAVAFVYPGILALAAIVSALFLRLVADRK
jgi:hypothetical protein